jgi:hypothetical protein
VLDNAAPRPNDHVRRARFYADVCEGLQRVALGDPRDRPSCTLERGVIWSAVERHGLVIRTQGGCAVGSRKAEGIL